jgi:hypothetical protein
LPARRQMDQAQTPEDHLETTPPPLLRRPVVARRRQHDALRPRQDADHPLPLPGHEDPHAVDRHHLRNNHHPHGTCGEPGAQQWARRVRRAVRGNPPAETQAGRPGPTQPGRRQDPQTGPARSEAADQRRHLRLPPGRRPARQGPGRATGEPLCLQGGRLTPRTPALRTSHSRAWPPPYDRGQHPGQGWAFLDRCHIAASEAAGPGGAPTAKRGRTTWRCGEAAATLGHEEAQGAPTVGDAAIPCRTRREEDRPNLLTQRGIRYARPAENGAMVRAMCRSG